MHRQTPKNSATRGYSSGGSRACVDQVDDNSLMQEHSGTMMANESRSGTESPQNYGFTSVNMPADKGPDGSIIASGECTLQHIGGNRSHTVGGPMDDRRHRLRGLSSGDVAMNRTNNDDMQIHLAGDGIYHSAPQMVRMQLVPAGSGKANPPQQKAKASATQQRVYEAGAFKHRINERRLWAGLEPDIQRLLDLEVARLEQRPSVTPYANGGGASGGGAQNPGRSLKTGQKAVAGAGADSKDFMHVKQDGGHWSSGKKIRLGKSKDDDDVLHETNTDGWDYCGGTPAKHKFAIVLTTAGPCKNVKGRIP